MHIALAALLLLLLTPTAGHAAGATMPPQGARDRVEYHVRRADALVAHFDGVLQADCPHFGDPEAWSAYLDGEVDRLVLLVAHIEEAWAEAKQTGDDDVRRAAKEPRRGLEQARTLGDKLQTCAADNGSALSPLALLARIQREVPRRRAEIALPK